MGRRRSVGGQRGACRDGRRSPGGSREPRSRSGGDDGIYSSVCGRNGSEMSRSNGGRGTRLRHARGCQGVMSSQSITEPQHRTTTDILDRRINVESTANNKFTIPGHNTCCGSIPGELPDTLIRDQACCKLVAHFLFLSSFTKSRNRLIPSLRLLIPPWADRSLSLGCYCNQIVRRYNQKSTFPSL